MPVSVSSDWTERWWYALGSDAHCQIAGGPDGLATRVGDEVERLEQCWSRFRADSELRRLDRSAGTGAVAASPDLIDAVGRAVSLWYVTDGRFDPTVRDALEAIGYDRTFREVAQTRRTVHRLG